VLSYPSSCGPWAVGNRPSTHQHCSLVEFPLKGLTVKIHSGTLAWTDSGLPPPGKETGIGRDSASPIAAIGVLSLGLLVPVGAGPLTDRAIAMLTSSVEGQTKTITLVRNGQAEPVRTRAATVGDLLNEQNIRRSPEDALDVDPSSPVTNGETIAYRAAISVTLVVDGTASTVRTAADTVGEVLANQHITFDAHDTLVPAAPRSIAAEQTIRLNHVNSWVERVTKAVPAPVEHRLAFNLAVGHVRVIQKGVPGQREFTYRVDRQADRTANPKRVMIANHILRQPRVRVVAAGVGEYGAIAALAKAGYEKTLRFARAAISMVATAYTANCSGCSGVTASGHHAGHGIVAVDPRVIPLGSHLYIPGYGRAVAGDTGGAIHGNRVDLGFNSDTDAMQFGRRSVTVYVLHP
jgi:3D (Asp-Asp-Asp) domain-containing protein